jgi:glycosyltransferase involved in cell wall biosynthesis
MVLSHSGKQVMRFAFISTMAGAPWGGSEELWSQAALRLHSDGHQIATSVVWWPQLSPQVLALAKQGIEIAPCKSPGQSSLSNRFWKKIQKRIGQPPTEFTWLRRRKPDLVIISQGGNSDGLAWMDFCRDVGLPFVSIIQCNDERWWPSDETSRQMAAGYRAAKKVFCVSHHNLELLERQVGESLPNAGVVWNPFNVSAHEPPAYPKQNGVWKLACVARLEPAAKGQDLLLEALAQSQWRERAVQLNFYGNGPCEQSLKKLAHRLQTKNVNFCGHVKDVRKIWEENHLLVLPSRYEGLPLALVEAMWSGRPAVVTDIGGNAEMCVDGETGFVAAAPAMKLLEETLERAWNNRTNWERMGFAARRQAEQLIPKDPVGDFCGELIECPM